MGDCSFLQALYGDHSLCKLFLFTGSYGELSLSRFHLWRSLCRDSSLWRLCLFTGFLQALYARGSSLWRVTFFLLTGSLRGTLLYGTMETFPLYWDSREALFLCLFLLFPPLAFQGSFIFLLFPNQWNMLGLRRRMALWAQMRQKVILTGIFTGRSTGKFLPAGKIAMKSHVPTNVCRDAAPRSIQYRPNEKSWEGHYQEIHSTLLTNAVKWETVLFYGLFTGSLLYGDVPFHTGTIVYGDFSSLRALCGGSSLGSLRPVFSVGTSFVYALYGGFSLWRLCLTGPSVECRARWFLIFPYLGKRKSLQREESP